MSERVKGLAEAYSMMGALPQAAREQLGVELAIIGRDVLKAQKKDVPRDTGKLEAGLGLELLIDRLRVRVGLLNLKRGRSNLFYGRIVEFGRRAQTVLVTRRQKVLRRTGNNRNGNNRRTIRTGKPYSMRVKAMAARPFVRKERPEIDVAQRLADFWSATLNRAGGKA